MKLANGISSEEPCVQAAWCSDAIHSSLSPLSFSCSFVKRCCLDLSYPYPLLDISWRPAQPCLHCSAIPFNSCMPAFPRARCCHASPWLSFLQSSQHSSDPRAPPAQQCARWAEGDLREAGAGAAVSSVPVTAPRLYSLQINVGEGPRRQPLQNSSASSGITVVLLDKCIFAS